VEAELFHADGQTDMKLIVTFLNFANAHKNFYTYFNNIPNISESLQQGLATYSTRAKRGTRKDFQWHAE
jgi:hypothetical protein